MKPRKIRTSLLGVSGIVYRLCVIVIQTIFFWIVTGKLNLALSTALAWNVINMAWYYLYHYMFAKYFRMGK